MSIFESILSPWSPLMIDLPLFGRTDLLPLIGAIWALLLLNIFFFILKHVLIGRLERLSVRTKGNFDDMIVAALRTIKPFIYTSISILIALLFLPLPAGLETVTKAALFALVAWQGIEIVLVFIGYGVDIFVAKDEDGDGLVDPGASTASAMILLLARVALWILGGLFVLSNIGVEVTSLIAGLGIGGVAVALALQGILTDLFASLSIYTDRPFRVGDYVVLGNDSGTVEKVGIKSTRIRTLQGEELVVSNTELTTSRVQNFKKMQERRIPMQFKIVYETPADLVARIPALVRECFPASEMARLDRVHFTGIGEYALQFEAVYFVASSSYEVFLDIQQEFNLALLERFASENIRFAYPTTQQYNDNLVRD